MNRIPELLAPAGSLESLYAAVNAGADAVYIGGSKFGARAFAENPGEDDLIRGIRYAHLFGVKVHLTVNTLLKEEEFGELYRYMEPYYEAGLDAAIVQDLGVFHFLHRHFPLLSLHASTQMTITGPEGAKFVKSLGASRVIPARELDLEEIRSIRETTGLETETFVHGALCYCYSGQCLMSSLIGQRSGNRGKCAQPCRLEYRLFRDRRETEKKKDVCLLSMKDLCSLDILPGIIDAGADSLKIEGRMKSPRYTAGTVSIWRKYLDLYQREGKEKYRVDPSDRELLLNLYDRGGQTEGYYREYNGPDMMAMQRKPEFRKTDAAWFDLLDRKYVNGKRKLSVNGYAEIRSGKPMSLTVSYSSAGKEIRVTETGPVPEKALKAAAAEKDIREKLNRTGETAFEFSDLSIGLDSGLFVPVKTLNVIRREALSRLEEEILKQYRRLPADPESSPDMFQNEDTPDTEQDKNSSPCLHVTCGMQEQIAVSCADNDVTEISFEADAVPASGWKETVGKIHACGKKAYLCMPQIFRRKACDYFVGKKNALKESGFDGFVIRSLEENGFLRKVFEGAPLNLLYDFNIYGMNREAEQVLFESGASRLTLPVELNSHELERLGGKKRELIVAGRLPMMVSVQCLKKNTTGCDRIPSVLLLKDRTGKEMPVMTHCLFCHNVILNADPLSLVGDAAAARRLRPDSYRILLTTENAALSSEVIRSCAKAFVHGETAGDPYGNYTRGHWKRGVE